MKSLVEKRVPIAWLLLVAIVGGAAIVLWKLAVLDAPPSGAALIELQGGASATITPFGGLFSGQSPTGPTAPQGSAGTPPADAQDQARQASVQSTDTPSTVASGKQEQTLQTPQAAGPAEATPVLISVYVSGAVNKPGVYTLPEGSRVDSAVAAAGGPMADADLDRINLAEKLSDEAHVTVYHKGEAPLPQASPPNRTRTPQTTRQPGLPTSSTAPTALPPKPTPRVNININTATAVELEQVPGIGPAIAQRIIADRERNGPFRTVEDLMRISGIKEGVLAKLRNYVTVGP